MVIGVTIEITIHGFRAPSMHSDKFFHREVLDVHKLITPECTIRTERLHHIGFRNEPVDVDETVAIASQVLHGASIETAGRVIHGVRQNIGCIASASPVSQKGTGRRGRQAIIGNPSAVFQEAEAGHSRCHFAVMENPLRARVH
jgi:hypothetical protein